MYKLFFSLVVLLLAGPLTLVAQDRKSHLAERKIPQKISVVYKNRTDSITIAPAKRTGKANILISKRRPEKRMNPFSKKIQLTAALPQIKEKANQHLYVYTKPSTLKVNAPSTNRSTSCLPDTIILASQAAIDNFSTNYPSCTTPNYLFINGSSATPAITNLNGLSGLNGINNKLKISNTSITTLTALNNLTLIGDTLEVEHNPLLTSFGLFNLDSVGTLVLRDLPALNDISGFSNNFTTMKKVFMDTTALTDLSGLSGLTHINGDLEIRHTPLVNLSDLNNLTAVNYLWLQDDELLTGLGLSNLTHLDGVVIWNDQVFNNIGPVTYQLLNKDLASVFFYNTSLTDFSGMDSATSFVNTFIGGNSNLSSMHGLEKLTSVNYGLTIWFNPVLTNLTALSGITNIDYDQLEISGNDALGSLTGLGSIINIGGGLWIRYNQTLTSLSGLNNSLTIQSNSGYPNADSVFITDNPQLALCSFAPLCSFLANNSASAVIHDNATGCSSISEIISSCTTICTGLPEQTWTGINSNDWNDPDNWAPSGVPGTCTKVTIPASYIVPHYPLAANIVSIGGLIMEQGAEMDMNFFNLNIKDTLWMENASVYQGSNIIASRIVDPHVHSNYIEGNFILQHYTGGSEFWFNDIEGNTVLSDSSIRAANSSTFLNYFGGDLTFINNSNWGSNYLSNASPGADQVVGNLTVINNSPAGISVGLGGGYPLEVGGDFIVNSSNGNIDINTFSFTSLNLNSSCHITQAGSIPITINNLRMARNGAGGAVLDQDVHINHSLIFDGVGGPISTEANKLLILNDNCTLNGNPIFFNGIIGPVKKIGNDAITLPLIDIENNTFWSAPISISAPALVTDEFTVQYFHHNPGNDGYDTSLYAPGFGGVSGREYWKLTRNNGNSKVKVTLSYDSARSGVSYLYPYMQVANWDPNLWRSLSSGGFTGQIYGGTLLSADSSAGGPVTFSFKPVRKPIITMTNLADSVKCLNTGFYVQYTADTAMIAGNTMRVEVSDTLGNFNTFFNPTFGSKITSAAADSIFFLSYALLPNKHYKIRVVGNLPPDTSINTRSIIFITAPQLAFNIIGPNPACLGVGVQKYYLSYHEPGANYTWSLSGGGSFTTVADTAFVTWSTTGSYNLTVQSSNQCGSGPQKIITVEVKPPAPTLTPTINNTGRWLYSSQVPALAGYQWYRNGTMIPAATNASYYASLAGDYTAKFSNFCGAGPVSNTISFAANSVPQTISFPAIPNKTYGDAPFVPNATASSGLPISFSIVSGPATINAQTNLLTITGTGIVTVKANQIGDNVYDTAVPVIRSFTVDKATQVISFPSIPEQNITNLTVTLTASTTSGLPISYSIVSGPATVSGNIISLTGLGTVTARASQTGDTNYLPAANVDRSFCTRVSDLNPISGYTNLCPGTAAYTVNNIQGATYFWRIAGGSTLASTTNAANVTWTTPGTYSLLVSASGNCGAASDNDTLVVTVINSIQPDSVQSMLPPNGAINQQLPLILSWVPAHPNNFYTFDLYVWRADLPQPGTPYAAGLTTVNYTLPVSSGLLSNQAYKWMVVSHNGSCTQINTGPIQQFTLIPLPDLVVQNVQAPTTAFSGQTVSINWTVKNNGPGNTTTNQNWTDAVFLSFDTIPNFSVPPETNPPAWNQLAFPIRPLLIGTKPNVSALDNGQQYSNSINFTLPLNYSQPLYAYIITNYPAGANAPQQVTFTNDTARAPQPITVTLSPTPDLRVDTVFTASTTFSGSTINLTYKVKNYGVLTPAGASWSDQIYISPSPVFNINTAIPVKFPKANGTYYASALDAVVFNNSQLLTDSVYIKNLQIVVPNYIFGTYFIYVFTNATNSLYEGALNNNNTNKSQLQIFLTPTPHLTVSSLTLPVTTASITQPIGANWNINNAGFNDNIERNKGHYILQSGTCSLPVYCTDPATGNVYLCGSTPGITLSDSLGFGSSYWLDRVYVSTDSTGLNIANSILVNETAQGVLNSGLNVSDNLLIFDCKNIGTNPAQFNVNTFNVIRSGSNHPKTGNFVVPDNLQPGNYFVYLLTNATKTVYEYPGTIETRRSILPVTIQRPDAVVSAISVPANSTGGQPVAINYSVLNNGPGAVFNHVRRDKIYVSSSAVFDGSAQLISTEIYTEDLPVGTAVPHSLIYTFPASTSGTRYFYVHTNFDSSFRETNPNNNISIGAGTIVSTAIANDLLVSSILLADTVFSIYSAHIKYTVSNSGPGTTAGTWKDSIFISCSPTFNPATSYYLTYRLHSETVPGGSSYSDSFNISIPYAFDINSCFPQISINSAYFFIKTNADNVVYEGSNGNNNVTGTGIRVLINPLVDHIVTLVTGPDTATVARPYLTNWTVKNIGYNPNNNYYYIGWYDGIYFSTDSVFNNNAVPANYFYETTVLNTNQSYSDSKNITPPNLPTGDYYVFARTNASNYIYAERVLTNNANLIRNISGAAKKIHVIQPLLPDLTDSILSAPAIVATGQPLTVVHRAFNNGAGVTYPANWSDDIWLSSDFIPGNGSDIQLSAKNHVGALQPGQFYNDTITATVALNVTPGNYVFISRVNATGNVFESNNTNDLAFKYITVYRPAPADLIVENIMKPDTVFLGYPIDTAKWVIKNIAANSATGYSSDGIYLSKSNILDSTAVLLGIKNKFINMGPLARDTITLLPMVNNVTEGDYNVIVKTDLLNNIFESDKTNNTGISTTPIHVSVKELPLNVLTANTLYNINRFYKLVIPDSLSGATIQVILRSGDSLTMRNEMYIGKGYVPSVAHFDYIFSTANYGNQDIVMTSVTAGVYYITIRCVSAVPVVQNITVKAIKLPFTILTVHTNSGGNIGNVTIKISGSLYTNNMTAKLSKPGTVINASAVYFSNSTTVYATFNLQGKPLGIYDVTLTKPDSSIAALTNGFSVVNANNGGLNNGGGTNTGSGNGNAPGCDPGAAGGINSQLVVEIVAPYKVLAGLPFVIQINYNNPTNFDVPAQIRVFYSERDIKMSLTQAGLANGTTSLYLELSEQDGPPGIIRAGGSGTVTVYAKAPISVPGHTYVNFKLK